MKTTHSEIEINYNENDNRWHFELRGRNRSTDSLAKAKEAIDKEPAEKRKQTFPRFEAYLFKSYESSAKIVTVTSVADETGRGRLQFWISEKNGSRSKEHASSLFPVNEKNTAIIAEIEQLSAEINALEEKKSEHQERLSPATLPKELV